MRHLLSLIIAVITVSVFFVIYANNPAWFTLEFNKPVTSEETSEATETTPDFKEEEPAVAEIIQDEEEEEPESEPYYGDTIAQYDNTTVCIYFGGETSTQEVSSVDQTMFITLREGATPDTCLIVDMHNGVWTDGETIYIKFGIDTLCANIRSLPHEINMMDTYAAGKGWEKHNYSHSFQISDSSWDCNFFFQAYLPYDVPEWTRKFMKTIISNDITALYLDNKGMGKVLNQYYGIVNEPKRLRKLDAASATPEQIAAHYAKEHERLYRRDYDKADEDGRKLGPKYDYLFKMNPAWQSKDGKYITYRFYTFYYNMGMHGYMEEYYLTFDQATGKLLGVNDIFKPKKFDSVIANLEKRINDYKHEYMNPESVFTADLGEDNIETNSSELLKETVKGKIYPRPAMTNKGVVFTYQPYEMGAFTEGVIHFVVPYSEIKNTLKIK
ncbi:MAG: RsiV family protein [Muribaculaceae bacterium]|nr:RsiV family protein [Muribaculaceae bacterium]